MIELIKITALMLSLSFRSANMPDMPYDFEVAGGIENKHGQSSYFYERENGKNYYGVDSESDYKYIGFTNYKRTAKNIDNQNLYLLYPTGNFRFGLSCGTMAWKNPQPLLTILWKSEHFKANYSKGKIRESIEIDIRHKVAISDQISIIPLFIFKQFNDKKFWQTKIAIEFKLL